MPRYERLLGLARTRRQQNDGVEKVLFPKGQKPKLGAKLEKAFKAEAQVCKKITEIIKQLNAVARLYDEVVTVTQRLIDSTGKRTPQVAQIVQYATLQRNLAGSHWMRCEFSVTSLKKIAGIDPWPEAESKKEQKRTGLL
jgi:hypothetical protein